MEKWNLKQGSDEVESGKEKEKNKDGSGKKERKEKK